MSNYGFAGHGFSLKALLENPELQTAPSINRGNYDVKKPGRAGGNLMPNANSAFLGSNLWEKPNGEDGLDLEYMDLDEFLSENGIPVNLEENDDAETISLLASALARTPPRSPNHELQIGPSSPNMRPVTRIPDKINEESNLGVYIPDSPGCQQAISPLSLSPPLMQEPSAIEKLFMQKSPPIQVSDYVPPKRDEWTVSGSSHVRNFENDDDDDDDDDSNDGMVTQNTVPGQENFDPTSRKFTEEELKPQPIIKKSKKTFVDAANKDDRYWQRRKKNNIAAKRSRDARRVKENQIAMRASFLETENDNLKIEMEKIQKENEELIKRLSKYEKV